MVADIFTLLVLACAAGQPHNAATCQTFSFEERVGYITAEQCEALYTEKLLLFRDGGAVPIAHRCLTLVDEFPGVKLPAGVAPKPNAVPSPPGKCLFCRPLVGTPRSVLVP